MKRAHARMDECVGLCFVHSNAHLHMSLQSFPGCDSNPGVYFWVALPHAELLAVNLDCSLLSYMSYLFVSLSLSISFFSLSIYIYISLSPSLSISLWCAVFPLVLGGQCLDFIRNQWAPDYAWNWGPASFRVIWRLLMCLDILCGDCTGNDVQNMCSYCNALCRKGEERKAQESQNHPQKSHIAEVLGRHGLDEIWPSFNKYHRSGCHGSLAHPALKVLTMPSRTPTRACRSCVFLALRRWQRRSMIGSLMKELPKSELQANFFADTGEKRSEILAKIFADFRPSISRESGRKKFHEISSSFSTRDETKIFHREILGVGGPKVLSCRAVALHAIICGDASLKTMISRKHPSRDVIFFRPKSGQKMPKNITSDDVLEPLKQVLSASRDVILSLQKFGSKLQGFSHYVTDVGCPYEKRGGKGRASEDSPSPSQPSHPLRLGERLRGNRPERFWEVVGSLRGSLRGSLGGGFSEVFRGFSEVCRGF